MRAAERPERGPERVAPASTTRRLMWFVVIWTMSVAALGAVAFVVRLWIG